MSADADAAHPERVEALYRQIRWVRERMDEQGERLDDLAERIEVLEMDTAEAGEPEEYGEGFGIDSADAGRPIYPDETTGGGEP